MSERKYPVGRVRLYDPGQRYLQVADGFGQYDVLGDLWRTGRVTCSTVDPRTIGIGAGVGTQTRVPTAMLVDDAAVGVVVCRPFLDTTQAIGAEHFDLHGGRWSTLEGLGIGSEVKLYQYDGNASGPTGAVSRFTLPRNPIFCVSLQRTDPAVTHDWAGRPPYTEVQLGVGTACEWSVVFPYGGTAFLMRRVGGQWERVPNSGRGTKLRKLEGYAPGERLLVWMAVWRGKLVVSTDGFADDLWVCPSGPETVEVPSGKIALWHNAGQWAFSVLPVKMVEATLDSQPIEAGFDTEACSGEIILQARTEPVRDNGGAVLAEVEVEDVTDARSDLTPYQRAWRARIVPYVHETPAPVFRTAVSPELHAVQIGQYGQIVDTGAQGWHEISDAVESAVGHATNDGRASVFILALDNSLGQYADLGEYRRCDVQLGWMRADGSAEYKPAIDGYIVEPDPAVLKGPRDRMEVVVMDPLLRLRDEKCDARSPVFDGWPVREVFEWVLDRCSVPAQLRDLEDTGVRLSSGTFDRPLWRVEPGRSWAEFLAEVAEFDHRATFFFASDGTFRKVCRYCRQKRTAEDVTQHDGAPGGPCETTVRWRLYTRAALAGGTEHEAAVLAIERPRRSLFASEFVNYVAVCGLGPDGLPVRSIAFEPASLYDPASGTYVGWRKMDVAVLETYTTQAEANRLAQEILQERGRRPEHVVILVPLEPDMQVGDIVLVTGGERVGADNHKYRVESVRHTVRRSPTRVASTEIVARWLPGE